MDCRMRLSARLEVTPEGAAFRARSFTRLTLDFRMTSFLYGACLFRMTSFGRYFFLTSFPPFLAAARSSRILVTTRSISSQGAGLPVQISN